MVKFCSITKPSRLFYFIIVLRLLFEIDFVTDNKYFMPEKTSQKTVQNLCD